MRGLLQLQLQLRRGRLIHATLSSQTNLVARCLIDLTPRWRRSGQFTLLASVYFDATQYTATIVITSFCFFYVMFFSLFLTLCNFQKIYVDKIIITTMFITVFCAFRRLRSKTIFTAIRQIKVRCSNEFLQLYATIYVQCITIFLAFGSLCSRKSFTRIILYA